MDRTARRRALHGALRRRRAQPPRPGAQPLTAAAWADERNRRAS
jgi:hypothetical protein